MQKISLFLISFLAITSIASAQTKIPTPKNIAATYAKKTRSTTGSPGENYWQNTADYNININFDPNSRLLNGTEEIKYFNNSNDTLKEIVFKLCPNYYKKGSPRLQKIDDEDAGDGINIESRSRADALLRRGLVAFCN